MYRPKGGDEERRKYFRFIFKTRALGVVHTGNLLPTPTQALVLAVSSKTIHLHLPSTSRNQLGIILKIYR